MEQKCALLVRQAAANDNARMAMNKQSQKRNDLIQKQQEREKMSSEQIILLEKENASRGAIIEAEKQKVADLMAQVSAYENQTQDINRRCENVVFL